MTPAEVARMLAAVQAFDRRTVGEADVAAWHRVLVGVELADALEAVARHYGVSVEWLMPAHVRTLVAEIRRERRHAIQQAVAARALEAEQARPTRDRSAELEQLLTELRDRLPKGDPDALRHGHKKWRQADERRERAEHAQPNPAFVAVPPPGGHPIPEEE